MNNMIYYTVSIVALVAFFSIMVYFIYLESQQGPITQGAWYMQPMARSQIGGIIVVTLATAIGLFVPHLYPTIIYMLILGVVLVFVALLLFAIIRRIFIQHR